MPPALEGLAGTVKDLAKRVSFRFLSWLAEDRVVITCVIILSFTIALLLRMGPIKWGVYLNEFDPFYEYYLAMKVLEKGRGDIFRGIAWWFGWWFDRGEKDTLFWAPSGRDLRASSQPGAALASACVYSFLRWLGFHVDLYTVHAFVPPVGAALASIFIYFLGREVHSREVGVLSAFFISVSWPFIFRTNLGAKHEGLAIPFMILAFYLFMRAYRKGSLALSACAGLAMGLVVLSWGAYLYPWNLLALTALIWLAMHPDDLSLARTFLTTNLIAQVFIAVTPRFGPMVAFCSAPAALPMAANVVSLLVLLGRLSPIVRWPSFKVALLGLGAAVAVGLVVLSVTGLAPALPRRVVAVVLPIIRETGVTTVQEHAVPAWSSLYDDYHTLMLFSFFAAMLLFRRSDLASKFLFILWFTSLYAATSMARLTLLYAPAVALVGSIGVVELTSRLMEFLAARPHKYKLLKQRSMSKEAVALSLIMIVILLTPVMAITSIRSTHQPALIVSSSLPTLNYGYEFQDWLSALEWIRTNIPNNTVIATWWDYGYWISVNTWKNTTCDNGTINSTQIKLVAKAFMSPEDVALKIFKSLKAEYVVVFEPFRFVTHQYLGNIYFPSGAGDFGKSWQMARWIGLDPRDYITWARVRDPMYGEMTAMVPKNSSKALNATIYKLLFVKTSKRRYFIFEPYLRMLGVTGYEGPVMEIEPPKHFELVYSSEPNEWVLVFRIKYNKMGT